MELTGTIHDLLKYVIVDDKVIFPKLRYLRLNTHGGSFWSGEREYNLISLVQLTNQIVNQNEQFGSLRGSDNNDNKEKEKGKEKENKNENKGQNLCLDVWFGMGFVHNEIKLDEYETILKIINNWYRNMLVSRAGFTIPDHTNRISESLAQEYQNLFNSKDYFGCDIGGKTKDKIELLCKEYKSCQPSMLKVNKLEVKFDSKIHHTTKVTKDETSHTVYADVSNVFLRRNYGN